MSTAADRALMMSGTMDTSGHGQCELTQVAVVFSENHDPETDTPSDTPDTEGVQEEGQDGQAPDTAAPGPADQPLFDEQGEPVPEAIPDPPATQDGGEQDGGEQDGQEEPVEDGPAAAKEQKASAPRKGARPGSGPKAAG